MLEDTNSLDGAHMKADYYNKYAFGACLTLYLMLVNKVVNVINITV